MTELELKERFRAFSVRIVKMVDAMPKTISAIAIAKQVVRSGNSPYANYRAACLGKSDKDFLNKLKMVEEELDETGQWLLSSLRRSYLNNGFRLSMTRVRNYRRLLRNPSSP